MVLFHVNLPLIQHLETLYLGENHVRVVCERMWRKAQECALSRVSRLDLATHSWQVAKGGTRVKHAGELKGHASCCITRQKFRSGQAVSCDSNSRLVPVTSSSRQDILFGCNWLFEFHTHPTINTLIPTKCRELPERILREKP